MPAQDAPLQDPGTEIKGRMIEAAASITRPANTTAYTARDAIADNTSGATILTFAGAARRIGKGGYIVGVRIASDKAVAVVKYKLHLFQSAPTVIADNSPMTAPLYADIAKYVGSLTLPTAALENTGGAAYAQQDTTLEPPLAMAYICDSDETNLYGMLETLTAFTPTSGQFFDIRLMLELN